MDKNLARRAGHTFLFEKKNVDRILADYLESISYSDPASGSSDTLDITLQNIDGKWLNEWYPKIGSTVSGKLIFYNWNNDGKDHGIQCGTFTLDEITTMMKPKSSKFACISTPAKESFKTRERDKTWEKVTIKQIATEICDRYKLTLSYKGPTITIEKLEQSETDSSFLSKLCDDYGLGMKIYRKKIIIYDIVTIEKQPAVKTLKLSQFEDVSFRDSLYGTYTGAKVSYKAADSDNEVDLFIGLKPESADGSRVLKANTTCESETDARIKGAAKVNKSNTQATTMSATLFPDPALCAGVCIRLSDEFGKMSGKYFIDKVTWTVTGNGGTSQKIDAHKVKKKIKPDAPYSTKTVKENDSDSSGGSEGSEGQDQSGREGREGGGRQ